MTNSAFKSLNEVLKHLEKAGYKISKSRIYRDKVKGMIAVQKDGSVLEAEVRAYAATYLDQQGPSIEDLNNIQAQKADLEAEKLREQIEKLRFSRERDQGKYIASGEVDRRMVSLIVTIDNHVRQLVNINMIDICYKLGGDVRRVNEARDFVDHKLDEMMNKMVRTDAFSLDFSDFEGIEDAPVEADPDDKEAEL